MIQRLPLRPSFPSTFTLHLGEARVVVLSELPSVARGLWAVWRSATKPAVPIRQNHELRILRVEAGVQVWLDGEHVANAPEQDALPVAERELYQHIGPWFEGDRAVLHAALLAGRDGCALLIGQSGAGKSSLSWSGIQRGYAYGADEVVLSDGEGVWGLPRAVLFDPTRVGHALPDVASGADRDRYCFDNWYGERCFLPICSPPAEQVLRAAQPLSRTHFVLLEHGEGPRFERPSSLEVLAALHREGRGQIERLVPDLDPRRCHRLRWQELGWAWEHLRRVLGAPICPTAPASAGRD